jgi:hypothetical protein
MTTPDSMTTPDGIPTTHCGVCAIDVPAGEFCGYCGSHLSPRRGDGPSWLRLRAYGAAPGEHVLMPSVASSLFPHLGQHSLRPFRIGVGILVVALLVFSMLKWQAPLIAVGALGLPVLFHLYLMESDAYEILSRRVVFTVSVVSIALGVGWAWATEEIIARSYAVAFGADMEFKQPLWEGVVIPVAGAILLLVPTVVARTLRVGTRETLDGFLIGAVAALSFVAAATLTRLAPQFETGLTASDLPMSVLMNEAAIRGLLVSLIAATAGGAVGAALWFKPDPAHQHGGAKLASPASSVAVVLVAFAALGLIDASPASQIWELAVYVFVAVLMVLWLRIVLHIALLRETHDPITLEPLLCENCGHVVPDMAFCPACGVATRASSRTSRGARRENRPVRVEPPPETP